MNVMLVNDKALEVRRIEGSSRRAPLVFLHEGLGSVALWTQRGLDWPHRLCQATERAGVVYSRRGYGQSEPNTDVRGAGRLPADYMHREAWEVLPALLQALDISRPVLLGHSDGASIALLHASRHPVAACIAMAPHVVVESVAIASIRQAKADFEAGLLRERLARYHGDVDSAFWQWNDVWLSPGFRNFDIRPDCQRITAPLLLLQGLQDEYGTLLQLDEIVRAAPHAQQLRLAACGHSPQRDQPERAAEAITHFLQSID